AIRHPSGALTFHVPVQSTSRGLRGPSLARFQVSLRRRVQTPGGVSQAGKAIVIKGGQLGADKLVSLLLPKLVEVLEKRLWKEHGLTEGWLRVTKETLASGRLAQAT